MVKYLIGIIILIFLFSTTSFFSFAQTANTKRESRNDRKEKKIDEIYQIETSNVNSLPFAEEFHLRYEKYLKESIRQQMKARFADAMYAYGEGSQGRTANPEVFTTTRIQRQRDKIYEDWINEVNSRGEQYSDKKEIESIIMKNVSDTLYEAGQKDAINKNISQKMNTDMYLNSGEDQYITDIIDGEIIKLDDGSLWQVEESDVFVSSIWIPIDDVVVRFNEKEHGEFCYQMKNEDEVVKVKLLNQ